MLQRLALGLCLLLPFCTAQAAAAAVITYDRGGRIGDYIDKYREMRDAGESVVIDGVCVSACTIVLGALPRERICVTARARLGFHQAWSEGQAKGGAVIAVANKEATALLMALYPEPVRRWIAHHGGLPPPAGRLLWLKGNDLARMYKRCP
jgi:hypothetical protein